MANSKHWNTIFPQLAERVLASGRVDPTMMSDLVGPVLSEADLRNVALDRAGYLARIARGRLISAEEHPLVMQLALGLGIACGLCNDALSAPERSTVMEHLAEALAPRPSWLREDLTSGAYASVSSIWPFAGLLDIARTRGRRS